MTTNDDDKRPNLLTFKILQLLEKEATADAMLALYWAMVGITMVAHGCDQIAAGKHIAKFIPGLAKLTVKAEEEARRAEAMN